VPLFGILVVFSRKNENNCAVQAHLQTTPILALMLVKYHRS